MDTRGEWVGWDALRLSLTVSILRHQQHAEVRLVLGHGMAGALRPTLLVGLLLSVILSRCVRGAPHGRRHVRGNDAEARKLLRGFQPNALPKPRVQTGGMHAN